MKALILSLLLVTSFVVEANECLELTKCIEYVSKLTGKKYIYDLKEVRGGLQSSTNFEINAANADTIFTYILDLNGYSRIPTAEKDTYTIISSRDIRYHALPMVKVDSTTPPKVIPNSDYYMMGYKFKHFKDGQLRMSANRLRPFMSRYARIIEEGDMAYVQEIASKLDLVYEMLKNSDRELSKEETKERKEWLKEDRHISKEERHSKSRDDKKEDKKEQKQDDKKE